MKHAGFTRERAEVLALQGVSFLASDDDRIAKFVATSGVDIDALRQDVNTADVLAGVMDYILADEELVLAFAEYAGVAPEAPALARQALPGFIHL